MGLEAATFIDDLVVTNPVNTDTKSQGDDHLRLLKTVLKNSIKRVTRAFYVPGTVAKSGNYTVLAADDNKTIVCDTTAAFTLTLPTLVAGDAGWCVYVLKTTTDANPVWIAPPSGTINGHTKVRRSVLGYITKVLWTGSVFSASRSGAPVGSVLDFFGTTLPPGHLWADGLTFTAADFVELNTALGGNTKPDVQGRVVAGRDDMSGTSQNRLTGLSGGVNGDTLGAAGGLESHTLTEAQMPVHDHDNFLSDPGHNHSYSMGNNTLGGNTQPPQTGLANQTSGAVITNTTGITITNVVTGGGGAHNNVQPTIIANKILVAE